jgi:hypothetical protein
MKKLLLTISSIAIATCFTNKVTAQTAGTLTFTFTEVAKSPTYSGNGNHCLAVWIQNAAGTFIKTRIRNLEGGGDHLPTWTTNSAGSTVGATAGATKAAFGANTITWDGKNAAATALVPDGVYKITIQSTWSHSATGTAITSYTFTKGPTAVHTLPTVSTSTVVLLSGVKLDWVPLSTVGVDESVASNPEINVYPNPTTGIFNVDFKKANSISVINMLGVEVYNEKLYTLTEGSKNIDLSAFANGIYFINVSNNEGSSKHKIMLSK